MYKKHETCMSSLIINLGFQKKTKTEKTSFLFQQRSLLRKDIYEHKKGGGESNMEKNVKYLLNQLCRNVVGGISTPHVSLHGVLHRRKAKGKRQKTESKRQKVP